MSSHALSLLACGLALSVLSGCASTQTASTEPDTRLTAAQAQELYEIRLAVAAEEAGRLVADGRQPEAAAVMQRFVAAHPDGKEGWLKLARLHFDGGSYGAAISAADEVLRRDGGNRMARSLQAVSGLRVASASLNALRDDHEMSGSARADALGLARVLRETLGESVFAQVAKGGAEGNRTQGAASRRQPVPPKPAASEPTAAGGDPFSVLR